MSPTCSRPVKEDESSPLDLNARVPWPESASPTFIGHSSLEKPSQPFIDGQEEEVAVRDGSEWDPFGGLSRKERMRDSLQQELRRRNERQYMAGQRGSELVGASNAVLKHEDARRVALRLGVLQNHVLVRIVPLHHNDPAGSRKVAHLARDLLIEVTDSKRGGHAAVTRSMNLAPPQIRHSDVTAAGVAELLDHTTGKERTQRRRTVSMQSRRLGGLANYATLCAQN